MALVNQDLTIDVIPGGVPPVMHLTEYDENMQVVVTLTQRGQAFAIPSGTTAKIDGTFYGRHAFSEDATVDGSTVTFAITKNMTAFAGRAWTKIKLTKDNKPVSTCGFWLDCDRAGVEAGAVIGSSGFQEQINEGVAAYFDNDPPFFELPSGGQSGQALFSDGFDGAFWGALPSGGSGLTDAVKQALLLCFQNVAWVNSKGQTYYQSLADALGGGGDTPTPGPTPSGLPSAFQEVEYIESTGTQYIVTDIVPTTNAFSFEIEFYRATQSPGSKAIIAGEKTLTTAYLQRFSLSLRSATNKIGVYSRNWSECTLDSLYGKKVKAVVSFYPSSPYAIGTISADGQSVEVQKTDANEPDIGEGRIVLFEAGDGSAIADVRIYSCVVKVGETVIADLVPCYRKSDNEIGMFDMVSRQFFGNAGTGTFLKGSDVS